MIYIFRPQSSTSARSLARELGATRERDHQRLLRRLRPGDRVVMYGAYLELPANVAALNNVPHRNKLQDAELLKEKGVPTIEVSRVKPAVQPAGPPPVDPAIELHAVAVETARDFLAAKWGRGEVYMAGLADFRKAVTQLESALLQPAPVAAPAPQVEWLGRLRNHVGGGDLLHPPAQPDFYVKKENIVREFRVHSFKGQSIRAGVKRAVGENAHQWVRSLDAGWKISYDGVTVRQAHRDIAHSAVKALGLDFGAVDIAERVDGSLIVLEVNRAPGLDGGTITAYANAVRKWVG